MTTSTPRPIRKCLFPSGGEQAFNPEILNVESAAFSLPASPTSGPGGRCIAPAAGESTLSPAHSSSSGGGLSPVSHLACLSISLTSDSDDPLGCGDSDESIVSLRSPSIRYEKRSSADADLTLPRVVKKSRDLSLAQKRLVLPFEPLLRGRADSEPTHKPVGLVKPEPNGFENCKLHRSVSTSDQSLDACTGEYQRKLSFTYNRQVAMISTAVMAQLVSGEFKHLYDRVIIVDARFQYEFEGGSIVGALNVCNLPELIGHLPLEESHGDASRVCVIIHCEFSQERGPSLYRQLREQDRSAHGLHGFPRLFYPELYILEGGYKRFYQDFPHLCIGGYVAMRSRRFSNELRYHRRRRIASRSISSPI